MMQMYANMFELAMLSEVLSQYFFIFFFDYFSIENRLDISVILPPQIGHIDPLWNLVSMNVVE
jgi:hypothetical protein